MANLLQVSILQDYDNTYTQPYATNVLRGTAPKGTEWNNLGGVVNPTSNSMMISTQSRFSTLGNGVFTFGFNIVGLPVDILTIAAKARGQMIDLTWVTANEENVSYYAVQRSQDGKHFTEIGKVKATGTKSTQTYRFTDEYPASGNNYYRLRQVEAGTTAAYSKIVVAKVGSDVAKAAGDLTIYPNPMEGYQPHLNVIVPEEVSGAVQVSVLDMKGQRIYNATHQTHTGNSIAIALGRQLPTGMYIVHVVSDAGIFQKKLVVR